MGIGKSKSVKKRYFQSVLRAERAGTVAHERWLQEQDVALPAGCLDSDDDEHAGRSEASRTAKHTSSRERLRTKRSTSQRRVVCGPVETAFPEAGTFFRALVREKDRCLSEQNWRFTDIIEDVQSYPFVSRCAVDLMDDAMTNLEEVNIDGEAEYEGNGDRVLSGTHKSDLYLAKQADVNRIHEGKREESRKEAHRVCAGHAVVLRRCRSA